jgi:hypothetical protein
VNTPVRTAPEKTSGQGRAWAIAGVIVLVVAAALTAFAVAMFFMVTGMLKQTDAYRMGVEALEANAKMMEQLGPPVTTGFPSGHVNTSGAGGEAELAIPVFGQKAKGTLYVEATKSMGVWKLGRVELVVEGSAERKKLIRDGTTI